MGGAPTPPKAGGEAEEPAKKYPPESLFFDAIGIPRATDYRLMKTLQEKNKR